VEPVFIEYLAASSREEGGKVEVRHAKGSKSKISTARGAVLTGKINRQSARTRRTDRTGSQ